MSLDILAKSVYSFMDDYNKKFFPENDTTKIIEKVEEEINHSFDGSFVRSEQVWLDLLAKVNTNKFAALSVMGGQGSGKTITGIEFVLKAQKEGFKIVYALPDDFMNDIEGWIDRVKAEPSDKYALFLDDLSYSNDQQNRKNQALLKNAVSRFRHKLKGKVLVIYITHKLHAAPPMLRNSMSWIFTEMNSSDRDDALEVIGKNKGLRERLDQIYLFLNKVIFSGAKDGTIRYEMDGKKYSFKWGKEGDLGDGRLMAIYHAGEINIYNSKVVNEEIDLDQFRFEKPEPIEVDKK